MSCAVRAATGLVLVGLLVVAPVLAAARREPARPGSGGTSGDETALFTGSEEVGGGRHTPPLAVRYWRVRAGLEAGPLDRAARVGMLVPLSDGRQDVLARRVVAPGVGLAEVQSPPNLRAEWRLAPGAHATIALDLAVRVGEVRAAVPPTDVAALRRPPAAAALAPEPEIQSAAAEVRERAAAVVAGARRLDEVVWSLHQYVAAFLPPGDPPGPQDALAVLSARRGTSLGRARALVALLRASGVPARLVGGLRLENARRTRATSSWVEAWGGEAWIPFDPTQGHFATLPPSYLALYRGDLPLLTYTRGLSLAYDFTIRQSTRRAVEEGVEEEPADGAADAATAVAAGPDGVQLHGSYVQQPVASVVLIADQSVPVAATDRILAEARQAAIDCVLLTARFESRYFRERYLERLVTSNLALVRRAHLVLVATADSAGAFALLGLAERGVRLPDARVIVAGAMLQPAARMLGALLLEALAPGEVALVRRPVDLLPLWEMARASLIDGAPLAQEAQRWNLEAVVLGDPDSEAPAWRRPLLAVWTRIVAAGVPLPTLTLILVLPIIATVVVAARVVVGLSTFGVFGPVIVSLAFITTGLWWGSITFLVLVGLGVVLRAALQHLRLQAVARLAILIALVAVAMAGLTLLGAARGIGPLLHLGVFPMLIMANVIESFGAAQAELGTRTAVRMTVHTLMLAVACYLLVDRAGLQSLVLAYPEILLGTVALDVLLGTWRGVRLLEYARFLGAASSPAGEPRTEP